MNYLRINYLIDKLHWKKWCYLNRIILIKNNLANLMTVLMKQIKFCQQKYDVFISLTMLLNQSNYFQLKYCCWSFFVHHFFQCIFSLILICPRSIHEHLYLYFILITEKLCGDPRIICIMISLTNQFRTVSR